MMDGWATGSWAVGAWGEGTWGEIINTPGLAFLEELQPYAARLEEIPQRARLDEVQLYNERLTEER